MRQKEAITLFGEEKVRFLINYLYNKVGFNKTKTKGERFWRKEDGI